MKIVEITAVPSLRVDDFCEPQLIGDDVHAIGYQLRKDPGGGETYGVVEVRMTMNAKKFFAACRRAMDIAQTRELPPELASLSSAHH